MPSLCFYFQVHQPYRLRRYTFFDLGRNHFYEDESLNCDILLRVARHCYLPMNALLLDLIRRYDGKFKVSFSLTGTALDQFEQWAPEVLESFKELAATGCVEFLSETDAHSFAFLFSRREFEEQVRLHDERIRRLFGRKPEVFRNTEFIYNNELAKAVEAMGYKAVLTEGAEHVLGWRSPNFAYQPSDCLELKLLLENSTLSDDIARHFSNRQWPEFPLTAEKFADWAHATNANGECLNLFMDYETFGEVQSRESGIFEFMRALPECVLAHPDFDFRTPSELAGALSPMARLDVPLYISWAEGEHDLTEWLGNDMQNDAIEAVYALEQRVTAVGDGDLLRIWRHLQTSEHFAYMSTKWFADGQVDGSANPYGSPYDAYINYMNVLGDFELTLRAAEAATSGTASAKRDVSDGGKAVKAGKAAAKPATKRTSGKTM